jgi:hypothetical protein
MKRLALVAVGAAAMALVAIAASFGAGGNGGPRDALWGGGHFTWYLGDLALQRDFSINVELGRFGDADGTFVYGNNGSNGSSNSPSCLAVSGNHAVIGGINAAGYKYVWYAVDNGTPASGTRDQVTPVLQLEPSELAQMPDGFPSVCPSPDSVVGGSPYSDLSGGDIVVRDAS